MPKVSAVPRVPRVPLVLAGLAALLGTAAALYYATLGLTLSHYDAKAHLVVSRRILDSLTPGWEQIGAVWLPLPHLVNMLPVQIDVLYRTGWFAVVLSIASHALATGSIGATVLALTSSRAGAMLAATLYAANPNVLYLQSTPMTEPMLFGLATLQVYLFTRWVLAGRLDLPRAAGWVTVLACLTRYEAWPITGACFALSAFAWWRRGRSVRHLAPVYARLALYPILTVLGFMAFSRMTVGEWFVSGGFFVPDDSLRGQPTAVLAKIAEGTELLGGRWLVRFTAVALVLVLVAALSSAGRAPLLIGLSLFAAAALPAAAYLAGHPFRLRYEIPIVVAGAVAIGIAVGLFRRIAPALAALPLALVLYEARPFDRDAPMVREAQLDRNVRAREAVTACLKERYRGGAVMVSMGALGHYMHEMAAAGFTIRDFLHEGNGPIWDSAFTRGPAALVEWVLVEEVAEGGDAIAQRDRLLPALLEDYEPICSNGNVTLYHRVP
ncbi:MAG TPA: hypothetical protein VMO26_15930 [Vicinamibacterales bacterium]|nr:hypothetical protein [Vicinamibacterales bacterium]